MPAQYHKINLACPEMPLPVRDPESGELGSVPFLEIQSRLSTEEAIGFLHRNYAPPSLAHTFLELIKTTASTIDEPGSGRLIALIGKKGTGKTRAAEAAFYLVDGVLPNVHDCGNNSLDETIWKPILRDNSKSPTAQLEERFNTSTLTPVCKNYIEQELPEAIITDEFGEKSLQLGEIPQEKIKSAVEKIQTAIAIEGIKVGTGMEIVYAPGILQKLYMDAQEAQAAEKAGNPPKKRKSYRLILDEIDKKKPGTGDSLQQVLLVLKGDLESHTVSKNGMEFTFSLKEMPPGFSVIITGNDFSDMGADRNPPSRSQASRMTILPVAESTEEDIAHRICQFLVGMPLGILDLLEDNKEVNTSLLQSLRTLGTKDSLTAEETWMLENYERTKTAAKQLAAFYHTWGKMVDPENPQVDDPELERNAAFREPPDVRMAREHVQRAKRRDQIQVEAMPAEPSRNPLEALLQQKSKPAGRNRPFGERLCSIIMESVSKNTAGSPLVKAKLLEPAKLHGIRGEKAEEKNKNPQHRTIADLLNTEEETFKIDPSTKTLQKNLFEAFMAQHKASFQGKIPTPDELLPLRDLQAAVTTQKERIRARETGKTTYILNINPNYLTGNKKEAPIECIPILCANTEPHYKKLKEMGKEKIHSAMMETQTLLAILKSPDIGENAMNALWNEDWKKTLEDTLNSSEEIPDCIRIASGSHPTIRIAKTLTMGADGPEASLIFQAPQERKTWIISENGKREQEVKGDTCLESYGPYEGMELLESIRSAIGTGHEEDIVAALHAFHLPGENIQDPETAIIASFLPSEEEKTKKTRRIKNAKLPLRLTETAGLDMG